MKVAVTGKGGVGKTTITAVLARSLARSGIPVVAVDADPNPNLAIAIGLGVDEAGRIESVANALLKEKEAHGHSHSHDSDHDDSGDDADVKPLRAQEAEALLAEIGVPAPDGVRLLQTGRIERPSEGCLCCGSHRSSRRVFDELDAERRIVVADLEAGVNDLMWVWPKVGDVVVLVTEPYQKSLEVAKRALEVTRELQVARVVIAANRIQEPAETEEVRAFLPGIRVLEIPEDQAVMDASARGMSPLDTAPGCPAVGAMEALVALVAGASVQPRST